MSHANPIAGGPDFILPLRNALEKTPNAYSKPPVTGGTQISSRFAEDRLALLDAICEMSDWNRNQVINALVDRGLYELFQQLTNETTNTLMDHVVDKILPTFDSSSSIVREIEAFNRFQFFPLPKDLQGRQLPEFAGRAWIVRRIDRDKGMVELQEPTAGWVLPPHVSHIGQYFRDTVSDAIDGLKHGILELNVQVVVHGDRLMLLPISLGSLAA
jgi:hypothetical protein